MISCNLLLIRPEKMKAQLKGRMETKNHETCACNYNLAYVWKCLKLQMGRMSQGGADNSRNELSGVSLCPFSRPQTKNWNISDHIFQTLDTHHCLLRWAGGFLWQRNVNKAKRSLKQQDSKSDDKKTRNCNVWKEPFQIYAVYTTKITKLNKNSGTVLTGDFICFFLETNKLLKKLSRFFFFTLNMQNITSD